jgi:cytochrome c oxidase subunit IV
MHATTTGRALLLPAILVLVLVLVVVGASAIVFFRAA